MQVTQCPKDELQIEHDRLIQELGNETMNLLENYMRPEDICSVLNKGADNAKVNN